MLVIFYVVVKSGDSNWYFWFKNFLFKIFNIKRVLINFVIFIEECYVLLICFSLVL